MRFFKLISDDNRIYSGRYQGEFPKQAASKAFTSICHKVPTINSITFSIKECTRGSKRKIYKYEGERIRLNEPRVVTISDRYDRNHNYTIEYQYINRIRKLRENPIKDHSVSDINSDIDSDEEMEYNFEPLKVKVPDNLIISL